MSDLIDRQALRSEMYHEAFEKDSDEQRWDSGCWIRYKMFERVVDRQPSAPERRGKWVYYEFDTSKEHRWRKCTQCGTAHLIGEEIPGRLILMWRDFKYCPNCGARMEGNDDNP